MASHPSEPGPASFRLWFRDPCADDLCVEQEGLKVDRARARASGVLLALTVGFALAYASGVGLRPGGTSWDVFYDVVLFNLTYLPAATLCWRTARRVPREQLAWRALGVSLLFNAAANAARTVVAGPTAPGPPRSRWTCWRWAPI